MSRRQKAAADRLADLVGEVENRHIMSPVWVDLPEPVRREIEAVEYLSLAYNAIGACDSASEARFHEVIYNACHKKRMDWDNWDMSLFDRPQYKERHDVATAAFKVQAKRVYAAIRKYLSAGGDPELLLTYAWRWDGDGMNCV